MLSATTLDVAREVYTVLLPGRLHETKTLSDSVADAKS